MMSASRLLVVRFERNRLDFLDVVGEAGGRVGPGRAERCQRRVVMARAVADAPALRSKAASGTNSSAGSTISALSGGSALPSAPRVRSSPTDQSRNSSDA